MYSSLHKAGRAVTGTAEYIKIGMRNNVVIHQDARVPWGDTTQNQIFDPIANAMVAAPTALGAPATGTTSVGRAIFMGAQAICYATGAISGPDGKPLRVMWNEEINRSGLPSPVTEMHKGCELQEQLDALDEPSQLAA